MSSDMYRRQLDSKRKQRLDAAAKAAKFRADESANRTKAAKARQAAAKASSTSGEASKRREADRLERQAASAGDSATTWDSRATRYAKEEAALERKLSDAVASEQKSQAQRQKDAERRRDAEHKRALSSLAQNVEGRIGSIERANFVVRTPKPEKLRILILGASSEGDLRIGREQKRIRDVVQSSLHRELVELDVRTSATVQDLFDGITKTRPHVVHFSGHSHTDLVVFDQDVDEPNAGAIVSADALARALGAADEPPALVVLNSCHSAEQLDVLTTSVAPFAIGMPEEVGDLEAINYAAQLYAGIADGQSLGAAHDLACAQVVALGAAPDTLPMLRSAAGLDPREERLVERADV